MSRNLKLSEAFVISVLYVILCFTKTNVNVFWPYIGKTRLCFLYYCVAMWYAQIIEYNIAPMSYSYDCTLHYHHHVPEGIEHLNACDVHSVGCMPKIDLILSIIFMRYMGLCVFSWPISVVMIVRICVLWTNTALSSIGPKSKFQWNVKEKNPANFIPEKVF